MGDFKVGDGEAETVQHHCGEVGFHVIAGEGAKWGGDAWQAEMGGWLSLAVDSGRPLVGAKVTSQAKATARDERSSALDRA
jgi:hypothetical protein